MQPSHRLPDGERIGGYTVERRLAAGSLAHVYLARKTDSNPAEDSWVALKLPAIESAEVFEVLRREAAALGLTGHQNVVRVVDDGTAYTPPYLATEYVAGVSLYSLRQRSSAANDSVPFELACYVCREVAQALASIHYVKTSGGVVQIAHGDVSPSNLFLSADGEVKLGDFGLAVVYPEDAELCPRLDGGVSIVAPRGHKGYLSPERLCGQSPTPPSDVFALGAILGELLIGGSVFAGEGDLARLLSARDGNIDPLLAHREHLPTALLALCCEALAPSPSERPNAIELAFRLTEFLESDQTSEAQLQRSLSAWVSWASNQSQYCEKLEQQIRGSVEAQRAAQSGSGLVSIPESCNPRVLRGQERAVQSVSFPELVELAASGGLLPNDEVALWDGPFQPVSDIPALARHVLPSTSALTSPVSPLGIADFVAHLHETSFFTVLANMAKRRATGALFVTRATTSGQERKDLYLSDGRLLHVTSTDRNERLGEYLVASGVLTRNQLSAALRHMVHTHGQLGESLITLKLAEPIAIFTALRKQGRDRVAAICEWESGTATYFAGTEVEQVLFPLDLDLHLCLLAATGRFAPPLPQPSTRLVPGPGCPQPGANPSIVPLLNVIPSIARKRVTLSTAIEELSLLSGRGVTTSPSAYLEVARALGWVDFA